MSYQLQGYAARFDTLAVGLDRPELIRRGAFAVTLSAGADVPLTWLHCPHRVLARTGDGTLALAEDHRGLRFMAQLADTPTTRDLQLVLAARDLGCSLTFKPHPGGDVMVHGTRELHDVELQEISLTPTPSYPDTIVEFL